MNVYARILQFTQVSTILGLALLLPSCSPIPREYIHQSERGITLSALVSEPNRYQGKIVILGGVIVEEKEEGDQVFLRLKNRPLDKDYVPHRPPSLDGSEAGYYWLTLSRHDLPNQYREWARVTVVGRVEGTRYQGEPLLNALYLRGWGEAVIETKKWKSV